MKRMLFGVAITILALLPLAAQTITVTSPATGNDWCLGSTHSITWTKSGTMPATVAVKLRRAGSPDSEASVQTVTISTPNPGSISWVVPASVPTDDYFIRVRASSTVFGDSGNFHISACSPSASITVTSPNGNEIWEKGSNRFILWVAANMTANCRLLLLKDGLVQGTIKDPQPPGGPGGSTIPWKVGDYVGGSANAGRGYKIRIESVDGQTSDTSDNPFTITAPPLLPDLIICLNWYGMEPNIYGNQRIKVHVRNIGLANAPPTLFKIYVEGHGTLTLQAPGLAPNAEYSWSQLYKWKTCGHKTVRATVDPNGQLAESNENNNVVESSIKVNCGFGGYLLEEVNCSDPSQHY